MCMSGCKTSTSPRVGRNSWETTPEGKKKPNKQKQHFRHSLRHLLPSCHCWKYKLWFECSHSDKRKHLGPSTASQEIVPHVHSSECWEAAWPQGEETLLLSPSLGEKCHWSPRWEQIFPKGATMPTNLACSPCQIFISPSLAAVRSYKIRIMHYPTS